MNSQGRKGKGKGKEKTPADKESNKGWPINDSKKMEVLSKDMMNKYECAS